MLGILKKLLVYLLIIGWVLDYGIPMVTMFCKDRIADMKADSYVIDTELDDAADFRASLKDLPSDIEGWSQLDKLDAGLDPADGSDTDGDGLTDAEELRIGSDPLKRSTAGDLYTDGYKVNNMLDVHEKYDREASFPQNECPEILFEAKIEDDLWAVAQDLTGLYEIKGYESLRQYLIYNYGGTIQIDSSDMDFDITDVRILVSTYIDPDFSEVSSIKAGSTITPDYTFEHGQYLLVSICRKLSLGEQLQGKWDAFTALFSSDPDAYKGQSLMYQVTLLSLLGTKPQLEYVPTGDPETDESIRSVLLQVASAMSDIPSERFSASDIREIDGQRYEHVKSLLDLLPAPFHIAPSKGKPQKSAILFSWLCMEDLIEYDFSTEKYDRKSHTGFNVHVDTFPFGNFGTEYSGGTCAGISSYTVQLFNTGDVVRAGSYDGLSWDLSKYDELQTLYDKGLYDYKNPQFIKSHGHHTDSGWCLYESDDLTAADRQFRNALISYHKKANAEKRVNLVQGISNLHYMLIEKMMDSLDNGKVLFLGASCFKRGEETTGGHAVVVYDYMVEPLNPDIIYFKVYDCNFPGDKGEIKGKVFTTMTVTRIHSAYGHEDSFIYTYDPKPFDKWVYMMTNDPEFVPFQSVYYFTVRDETMASLPSI